MRVYLDPVTEKGRKSSGVEEMRRGRGSNMGGVTSEVKIAHPSIKTHNLYRKKKKKKN